MVVNEDQAKVVEQIYGLFISGLSPVAIAKRLTESGVPSPTGKEKWYEGTVRSILKNEKYKGCALLQKTYTPDFLTKKAVANDGMVPQYYAEDSHPAIIAPEQFALVQDIFAERSRDPKHSGATIFSGKIRCGCCGGWYGSKVWHSNDKYRRVIWQCNHKFDGEKCSTPTMTEDEIKAIFLRTANQVIDAREEITAMYREVLLPKLTTEALQKELEALETEIILAAGLIEECIKENAHVALDQAEYQKRYEALSARYDTAKARQGKLTQEISARQARRQQIELFLKGLQDHETLTVFRDEDWLAMVDHMTVRSATDVTMTFKDGTEIKA